MPLVEILGLRTFLTLIFRQIDDTEAWAILSGTCRLARLLGRQMLKWSFVRFYKYPIMPSGAEYHRTRITQTLTALYFNGYAQFDRPFYKWDEKDLKIINDRFYVFENKSRLKNGSYVKMPEGCGDFVVLEVKNIRKEVISFIIGTPYVKVRLNATRMIEHRFTITGVHTQRLVYQGKGNIKTMRHEELDKIDILFLEKFVDMNPSENVICLF